MSRDEIVRAFEWLTTRRKDADSMGGSTVVSSRELEWLWEAMSGAVELGREEEEARR